MKAAADPLLGRSVLSRYRVVRVLAQGGMGVVYLGRTEGAAGFSRPVVIKRILPHLVSNPRMAGLFVREARILSELQHPGIVSILDFGEDDGAYIMVLEFVRGYDLGIWHRYLRETGGLFSGDVALVVVVRMLEALHYAHTFVRPDGHRLEVVHRDVSPGNVLLDTEGHVKLLDFGIARFSDDAGEYRTKEGEFKGKAAYTAPEIFRGADASIQSDVFAAGVVLYKILAGFNPFEGDNSMQTVKRIAEYTPGPICQIRTDLRRELDGVLARALAKEPEHRFATAAEFAEALRGCRRQSEEAAQSRLVADIQRDFLADLPAHLGIESISILDSAWRVASTQEFKTVSRPEPGSSSGAPTVHSTDGRAAKPAASSVVTWSLLGLTAAGLAGAGILALRRSNQPPQQAAFIVVQNTAPAPDPASEPPPEPPSPAAAAAQAPAIPSAVMPPAHAKDRKTRSLHERTTATGPDPVALTKAFRRQQSHIEHCFETHAAEQQGAPEVAIAFTISRAGAVEAAKVVPEKLNEAPLGHCLLKVARATSFGPQTAGFAFRIPLRARHTP